MITLNYQGQSFFFDSDVSYEMLRKRASKNFQLFQESIEFTFLDEEGDRILVANDEDIQIMVMISDGNLNVKGTPEPKENLRCPEKQVSETEQQSKGLRFNFKQESEEENTNMRETEKMNEIDAYLQERVQQLVDLRLKAMLPGIQKYLLELSGKHQAKQVQDKKEKSRQKKNNKKFDFNSFSSSGKKKQEKENQQKNNAQEVKKENEICEKDSQVLITESMLREPEIDSRERMQAKAAIMGKMRDIFGEEDTKKYYSFINKHFSLGQAQIIHKWCEDNGKQ